MLSLVIPSSPPADSGGVCIMSSFIMNIFSALPSATFPCEFNIIASSYPLSNASILAKAALA